MRRLFWIILLIGILFRIMFFIHSLNTMPISTDEACIGLMAKHIIRGELPLIYWGVGYQGPVDSYLNVPVFLFFNLSVFSMRILTLIGSILFLVLIYIFGKNLFGKPIGLLGMLFTAIPPAYLAMAGVLAISPYNYYILVSGTLILILAHKVIYTDLSKRNQIIHYIILGFLSGVMFWFHLIIVYYLITVIAFLFLKDKLFFIRKNTVIAFIFFCIGSLPLWIYNFRHNFESFSLGRSDPLPVMFGKLKILFTFTLPAILGFHVPMYIDNMNFIHLPNIIGVIYALVLGILFLYILFISLKGILRVAMLSLKKTSGIEMPLFFLMVAFVVFAKTDRSNWWALRYIEPIFSAFPILMAFAIYRLSKYSRIFSVSCAGIILFVNLYGGMKIYDAWSNKKTVEVTLELPYTDELINFLHKENINRVFAHYWIAYRITFETNEGIIASPAFDERFGQHTLPYLRDVEVSPNPAYVFYKGLGRLKASMYEFWIKEIGGEYKKKEIGNFTVFYSFKAPFSVTRQEGLNIIPRGGWRLSSNYKSSEANNAIDGDILTRWGSGAPQNPGMYFLIDLGKIYKICKIKYELGRFVQDRPSGYTVMVSSDGHKWQEAAKYLNKDNVLFWEDEYPKYLLGNYFNICFEPVPARFIKIIHTGKDEIYDWSIAEINVYEVK